MLLHQTIVLDNLKYITIYSFGCTHTHIQIHTQFLTLYMQLYKTR